MMQKKKKKLHNGAGKQLTATISVALVLLILGIVGLLAIGTRSVTDNIKENLGFTLVMKEDASEADINSLKQAFTGSEYVSSFTFLSSADILRQEEELMGIAIEDVVGVNPYQPEFNVKVKAQWANGDSITMITERLSSHRGVDNAVTHTEMVDEINTNIRVITMVLLAVAVALLTVSFVLINNTVRLTIYSRRFLLHTMQLVGATPGFIRRPIIVRNVINGIVAAVVAILLLEGVMWIINSDPQTSHEIDGALPTESVVLIFAGMVLAGALICGLAALMATNKYLRRNYDELF